RSECRLRSRAGMLMRTGRRFAIAAFVIALGMSLALPLAAADRPPALAGTHWQLLSLTEKGEKIKDAETPAQVEFTKEGKWGIAHYAGEKEGGTWKVKGDRLIMTSDDGTTYQDARMAWKESSGILELDSGKYLMRLRRLKETK